MAGVQLLELPYSSMLDVLHSLRVDDALTHATVQVDEKTVALHHRERARDEVEKHLDAAAGLAAEDMGEDWGVRPEHQASMVAAMAAVPRAGAGPQ